MAEMADAERRLVWAEVMQDLSNSGQSTSLTKSELRAAVDAIDTWLNSNAVSLNAAMPQPARGALTTTQKARLLQFVVARRYLTGA
jgi:hypothetical protein